MPLHYQHEKAGPTPIKNAELWQIWHTEHRIKGTLVAKQAKQNLLWQKW